MKHKTADLTGPRLDAAVARALGLYPTPGHNDEESIFADGGACLGTGAGDLRRFAPSIDWFEGGPIIQIEMIQLMPWKPQLAHIASWTAKTLDGQQCHAHTPLVAAMRAYVASKLGEEVELP